mgnify:CR=1 FL=1
MQICLLTYDTPPKEDKGHKACELHLEGLDCDFGGLCIIQMLSHICGQFVLWELWTFCCTKTFKKVVKLRWLNIGSKVCQVVFVEKIVESIWHKNTFLNKDSYSCKNISIVLVLKTKWFFCCCYCWF